MKSERRKFGMVLAFAVLFAMSVFINVGCASGAPPEEEWSRVVGGGMGHSVQQTIDGGYAITGCNGHVCLIKTDSDGNVEWNKTFGGSYVDSGESVQQTIDGGYIIAGYTYSYGAGNYDVWLIKTDSNGNEEWNTTFGGSTRDEGWSVQQTTDGGYVITGYTSSYGDVYDNDIWLIKTDSNGNEEWNRTYGWSNDDNGCSVKQTSDGGYIVTGNTRSFGGGLTCFLIKTDLYGNKEWNKTFRLSNSGEGYSVQQTTDGGYALIGVAGTGEDDIWLIKTDSNGNEEWNTTFGGPYKDGGISGQQTTDRGYIIAGVTRLCLTCQYDIWLIKTDSNGNEEWNTTFGGPNIDFGRSVQQTTDGGYIITGYTMSYGTGLNIWLIKVKGEQISIFDTEPSENPYPSIMGTHKGEIKPSHNINVSKLYTYPCVGTGGHTESIELYENTTLIASGTWNGYQYDYHNISITPFVTLLAEHTYNYIIVTGSYPQIIHAKSKDVIGGTITCTSFVDANGKSYDNWIPAIRLE